LIYVQRSERLSHKTMTPPETDLFSDDRRARRERVAPLPARVRPTTLNEVVGQRHLLGEGAAFRSMVEQGRLVSILLWGPPGTGKTTVARVVAAAANAEFVALSAVTSGVKEVRETMASARHRLEEFERRTVLFLDEIHRFSKSQQDALLPGVEDGTVILIGATTENPFFEVNAPLLSRLTLFRLELLSVGEVAELVRRAVSHPRGLKTDSVDITEAAVDALTMRTGGDARMALTTLETAAILALGRSSGSIEEKDITEAMQRRVIRYDKDGDQHYDVISAFIKSMRGSDPDAALYWLHTMLGAGEDPKFIARRMIVFASEDVGLADSNALGVAVAASEALQFVGLPEAAFALSHATLYLSAAPKSNSVTSAMQAARKLVQGQTAVTVPEHLRDSHYQGAADLGHGDGYKYPHSYPDHVVPQAYFPPEIGDATLYTPSDQGVEARTAQRLAHMDALAERHRER